MTNPYARPPSNTPWRRSTPANTTDTRPRFANSMSSIPVPQIEPEFDRILRDAGIKQEDAFKYLFVRAWIKSNYRRCFVPPAVLEQMGLVDTWNQVD